MNAQGLGAGGPYTAESVILDESDASDEQMTYGQVLTTLYESDEVRRPILEFLANAVADALRPLGIQINELPVTPERLFRLINAARPTA